MKNAFLLSMILGLSTAAYANCTRDDVDFATLHLKLVTKNFEKGIASKVEWLNAKSSYLDVARCADPKSVDYCVEKAKVVEEIGRIKRQASTLGLESGDLTAYFGEVVRLRTDCAKR